MFVLTKLVSRMLFPVPLCALLLVAGMVLAWQRKRKGLGRALIVLATFLLVALASQPVSTLLVGHFERQYPPLGTADALPADLGNVQYVVVLTGGDSYNHAMPLTRQMDSHALMRLVEGVRIYKLLPDAKIVLSGGYGAEPRVSDGDLSNYAMVRQLGVPTEDIVTVNTSRNTAEEAHHVAPIVGQAPFVLVASASHMPRAMLLFRAEGLDPIAAPTDYYVGCKRMAIVEDVLPSAGYLWQSERAVYEVLGIAWARLHGAR